MNQQNIIACYNATAEEYADNLFDELSKKPLDRLLLRQFAIERYPYDNVEHPSKRAYLWVEKV